MRVKAKIVEDGEELEGWLDEEGELTEDEDAAENFDDTMTALRRAADVLDVYEEVAEVHVIE